MKGGLKNPIKVKPWNSVEIFFGTLVCDQY
jgi:hypothetical protein